MCWAGSRNYILWKGHELYHLGVSIPMFEGKEAFSNCYAEHFQIDMSTDACKSWQCHDIEKCIIQWQWLASEAPSVNMKLGHSFLPTLRTLASCWNKERLDVFWGKIEVKRLAVTRNRTQNTWLVQPCSALPLSYNNRTTTSLHNSSGCLSHWCCIGVWSCVVYSAVWNQLWCDVIILLAIKRTAPGWDIQYYSSTEGCVGYFLVAMGHGTGYHLVAVGRATSHCLVAVGREIMLKLYDQEPWFNLDHETCCE